MFLFDLGDLKVALLTFLSLVSEDRTPRDLFGSGSAFVDVYFFKKVGRFDLESRLFGSAASSLKSGCLRY